VNMYCSTRVKFRRYPFRCHSARVSVIKYTAKVQPINGLE
jgi:hypothetical protein